MSVYLMLTTLTDTGRKALQDDPEPLKEFMDKKKYSFPVWLTLSPPPDVLKTKSIPTTFIVNKRGQIVYNKSGAFDWNSKKVRDFLDTLLSE